jgi:hypothetical protein
MFGKGACGVETASAFLAFLLLGPAGGVLAVLDCGNVISVHSNSADSALEVVLAVIECGNIISVHLAQLIVPWSLFLQFVCSKSYLFIFANRKH